MNIDHASIETNFANIRPSFTNIEASDVKEEFRTDYETRPKNMRVVFIMKVC